ncbi:MAG: hypothetical protein KGI04_02420 [Candidatus Micrarchaeota archaeon]|nr:hypothetical protein [Candidatus Micrarchaeota archaeon]
MDSESSTPTQPTAENVETPSFGTGPQEVSTGNSATRRKVAMIFIVMIAIAAVAYYLLAYSGRGVPVSTTSSASTSATTSIQVRLLSQNAVNNSLLGFSQLGLPNAYGNYSSTQASNATTCGSTISAVYRLYALPATLNATNYSMLNQSLPFVVYENALTFAYAFPAAKAPQSCTNIEGVSGFAQSNSTLNVSNAVGTAASLIELDNFSAAGLNATHTLYTGPMPHLSWYEVDFAYRNVLVYIGIWGFTGHMDTGKLLNYSKAVYSNLLASSS